MRKMRAVPAVSVRVVRAVLAVLGELDASPPSPDLPTPPRPAAPRGDPSGHHTPCLPSVWTFLMATVSVSLLVEISLCADNAHPLVKRYIQYKLISMVLSIKSVVLHLSSMNSDKKTVQFYAFEMPVSSSKVKYLFSFCAARTIRDSGYSSGDPSPNNLTSAASSSDLLLNGHESSTTKDYHRSNSMPAPQSVTRNRRKTKRPSKWHNVNYGKDTYNHWFEDKVKYTEIDILHVILLSYKRNILCRKPLDQLIKRNTFRLKSFIK